MQPLCNDSGCAFGYQRRTSSLFTVFALTLLLTALNLVIHKWRLRVLAFVLFAAAMLTSLLSGVVFLIAVILLDVITELARIRSQGLLTEDEVSSLSPETRGVIPMLLGVG